MRLVLLSSLFMVVTPVVSRAQAAVVEFVRDVAPILEQHCVGCHGPKKQKGDLRLDRKAHLFAGEATAWSVQPGNPDASDLLRRVLLPVGDEDVMPNEGDRLHDAQIATLRAWIEAGADWPTAGDEYFAGIEARAKVPHFDFGITVPDAATQARIDAAIAQLGEHGVLAQRVAADTPAVDVNAALCGKAFGDAELALLSDLAPVLVWLNLARTNVTDPGLAAIATLPQLRRLNLANTGIGDAGLAALGAPPQLEVLNVYGAKVGDGGLSTLRSWPRLVQIYAFDTAVTAAGAAALTTDRPELHVDRGEYAEARLLAAQAEIAEREAARAKPVNSTCPVSGEAIVGDQVVDHDGLRIAFCCAKCKARFVADPKPFAEQIAGYHAAAGKLPTDGKGADAEPKKQ